MVCLVAVGGIAGAGGIVGGMAGGHSVGCCAGVVHDGGGLHVGYNVFVLLLLTNHVAGMAAGLVVSCQRGIV